MRQRAIGMQLVTGGFILVVLCLLIGPCIHRVRLTLAFKYHQIYVGMPEDQMQAVFADLPTSMPILDATAGLHQSWGTSEGWVWIITAPDGNGERRVVLKEFHESESTPWFVRLLLKDDL